jgi:hypothetical protein
VAGRQRSDRQRAVVLPGASLLEPVSGYTSEALRAEPLWVTAARGGRRATMLCATQDYPYEPYEAGGRFGRDAGDRLVFLTGYKGAAMRDAVYKATDLPRRPPSEWRGAVPKGAREIELRVGDTTVSGLFFDDPGLLALDGHGRIDPARTKVYFLEPSGYFLLNRIGRPGGCVRDAEVEALRAQTEAVLRRLRDPRSGQPVVEEVFPPGVREGTGGPHGGALYLRTAPHVLPTGETLGSVVYEAAPRGEHVLAPDREDLYASFVVAGPGVAPGVDLGIIRQVDVAPTLATLLRLPPPAQARGVVLERAQSKRQPCIGGC